jgi:Arc/MetJ-type ribon-helix-helix transcriptional regulator
MGKHETVTADLDGDLYAEVQRAVEAGAFASVGEAVAHAVALWADARREHPPEFVARARAAIAESRADAHPGYDSSDVFSELHAELAAMEARAAP